MRTGRLIALCLLLAAVSASAETLEQKVDRMERELQEMKAELKRRDAADRKRDEAERQRAAEQAAPKPAETETAAAPAPGAPAKGEDGYKAMLPSGVRSVIDRVKLGGYGSFRYEGSSLDDLNQTFTFRRFVLTVDAELAKRMRSYFEVEFERFRKLEVEKQLGPAEGGLTAQQAIEAKNESEISLEQAWLQYDIQDWLKFRGGAVLVPLGRFNINHDDNKWDIARRSLVDRGVPVLPSKAAWDELGVGFLGEIPVTEDSVLNYQAYVVNGVALDFESEQVARSRFPEPGEQEIEIELQPDTGTFSQDVKNAKAFTGRLGYSPALGQDLGFSWYWGRYTPEFLDNEAVWSLAGDWLATHGPFEFEGEYVYTRFNGTRDVAKSLARVAVNQEAENETPNLNSVVEFELANLASTKQGYWMEGRYRFWPSMFSRSFLGWEFDNPQLVAVLRGEQVWLDDLVSEATFAGGRLTAFDTENARVDRITAGLAYRPTPLVVFQIAYEWTHANNGTSLSAVTNFLPARPNENVANTILIGAAFGF